MKVFIPGGGGYVGSLLTPFLLEKGYFVTVYDLFLYGLHVFDSIKHHPRLRLIQGDIRDFTKVEEALKGSHAVIHLACISNDPSFELNPDLGRSINLDAFEPFVQICKRQQIERFIYASSSSVYGVQEGKEVVETVDLKPLTDYSKFKAACEDILLRYQDEEFICCVLRPATVCGYARRQRLDLIVNILTNHAYHLGSIQIMGGEQLRPNIHIKDMVRAYYHVLKMPKEKIQGQVFNVGYQNHTVQQLSSIVQSIVGEIKEVRVKHVPTNDPRSYHISSQKIGKHLDFYPRYTIEDAVVDLVDAFKADKLPHSLEDKRYFNIKTMQALNLR